MQIEDIGQLGILIISQQPGIGIEFGSQDEFSTESLKDEFILPIVETGAQAHAMVLSQSGKVVGGTSGYAHSPVMRSRHLVHHMHIHVGLCSSQQEGGAVLGARTQIKPVVEQHEIGTILTYACHHAVKVSILLWSQLAAHGIHLEESETVIPHQGHHHLLALQSFLLGISESIGASPQSQAGTHLGCLKA